MGEVAEDSEVAKYLEKVGLTQKDFLYLEVEVHGKIFQEDNAKDWL